MAEIGPGDTPSMSVNKPTKLCCLISPWLSCDACSVKVCESCFLKTKIWKTHMPIENADREVTSDYYICPTTGAWTSYIKDGQFRL